MLLLVQVHILLGHKNLSLRRVNLKMVQAVLIVKRVLLVTNLYLSAVVLTSVKGKVCQLLLTSGLVHIRCVNLSGVMVQTNNECYWCR